MSGEPDEPLASQPGIQLNRRQLTLILVGVPLLGLTLAYLFSLSLPERPEVTLSAEVHLEFTNWRPPKSDPSASRLMPCVVLENASKEAWNNVAISLDKQFYYYHYLAMGPQEKLVVPFENFVTKGGNVNFRPASQKFEKVTVFAQIPSGERAVFETKVEPLKAKTALLPDTDK